jgi:hypothetical protein
VNITFSGYANANWVSVPSQKNKNDELSKVNNVRSDKLESWMAFEKTTKSGDDSVKSGMMKSILPSEDLVKPANQTASNMTSEHVAPEILYVSYF